MATKYGNNASSYWRVYLIYSINNTPPDKATITCYAGINFTKAVASNDNYTMTNDSLTLTIGGNTYVLRKSGNVRGTKGQMIAYGSATVNVDKGISTKSITVSAKLTHGSGSSYFRGTSTVSATVQATARPKYALTFYPNVSDTVTNMPQSPQYKYYGYPFSIPPKRVPQLLTSLEKLSGNTSGQGEYISPPKREGYKFRGWAKSSATATAGTVQVYGGTGYTTNAAQAFYAVWSVIDPPTVEWDAPEFTIDVGGDTKQSENVIRNFTDITVNAHDIVVQHDDERTFDSVKLECRTDSNVVSSVPITDIAGGDLTIPAVENGTPTFTSADDGNAELWVVTEDDAGAVGEYLVGEYTIVPPTWNVPIKYDIENYGEPQAKPNGDAIIDSLSIARYVNGTLSGYDSVGTSELALHSDGTDWWFTYTFDENHVDDPLSLNPNVKVKFTYTHYDIHMSEARSAFYSTTRNQNYSNGIYNQMFISGVDAALYPGFASRAWWCQFNNPLYFPDTNYIEAGSNDTAILGLTKVGDYLGIIKQSKTTDTAIYLAYPTSFEEDTTFAVKQGVQGVGAISKYSFNILGDESLFLSPNGVVAIVPNEDNEHKVQNRSYYVDGKLLKDSEIDSAYSFVFDGMYYLAIGNMEGSVYVLDGNQRNSWGNDRTNLVYECYYLENIPATCLFKMNDRLLFSNADEVCAFTDDYWDAYDMQADDKTTPIPVPAEWSTVLDDDGSLHYYKTMQKKGNLISILPIENERPYKQVDVDKDTYDTDRTLYYVLIGEELVHCEEDTEYIEGASYYIENRSRTKVFVRKDLNEPVEIQRTFSLQSEIPSEMFFKKKFKKYKRLQFIVRNEAEEDFGIDSIVKNYTVGNYAKK